MLLLIALTSVAMPAPARAWTAAELVVARRWIASFDSDHDGKLSLQEFPCSSVAADGQCNVLEQMLNAELYDRDNDNFVTAAERLAVNTRNRDVTRDRHTAQVRN